MFNLFGSLFFGRAAATTANAMDDTSSSSPAEQIEVSTQTTLGDDGQQLQGGEENANVKIISQQSFIGPLNYNDSQRSIVDWVIVDRLDEADKCSTNATSQQQQRHQGMNTSTTTTTNDSSISRSNENIINVDNEQQQEEEEETMQEEDEQVPPIVQTMFERADDDNEIILGSFFEKNETESDEDAQRYSNHHNNQEDDEEEETVTTTTTTATTKKTNDWQITPLPCLTSTTESQQRCSLVAEDPLENLLIEHPSMSVFVSATSSSSSASSSPVNKKKCETLLEKNEDDENDDGQEEDSYDDMLSMLFKNEQYNSQIKLKVKSTKKKSPKTTAPLRQIQQNTTVAPQPQPQPTKATVTIVAAATSAEKRMLSLVNNLNENNSRVMSTLKRKKNRKSKKSSSSSSSSSSPLNTKPVNDSPQAPMTTLTSCFINKENMQVKALLLNECKRNGVASTSSASTHRASASASSLLDSLAQQVNKNNKNQLRRANKNALFAATSKKNVNHQKQRKYHKLQQPACSANYGGSVSNMQF